MCEAYNYIPHGIEKKSMKMYHDNVVKQEHTALRFPRFKHRDGVQKLVAGMPDDQAFGE